MDLNVAVFDPTSFEELKKTTRLYGDFVFDDDTWYFSKKHRDISGKHKYTISFAEISDENKVIIKSFVLLSSNSINRTKQKTKGINHFFEYFKNQFPKRDLSDVNDYVISCYEEYLRQNVESVDVCNTYYSGIQEFFHIMSEFPQMPDTNPTKRKNPFIPKREVHDDKYIPKEVIRQWDRLMKDETKLIPVEIRTAYWLLRTFPNRVTEICSLETDCLKSPYHFYTLTVPQFKQNGGYIAAEPKVYPILFDGHGKYIIELIQRLKRQTESYLEDLQLKEEKAKKYLFLTTSYGPYENVDGMMKLNDQKVFLREELKQTWALDGAMVGRWFKKIADAFEIKDKSGNIYYPTPHQFRHNAITDRLYAGTHSFDQVTQLSGHKSSSMPLQYAHQLKESHKRMSDAMLSLRGEEDAPVEVNGVIMNLDEKTVERIEKNKRAYLTFEVNGKKGVGICSDIHGCNPKGTSYHFECYACDWFVPRADFLDDYQKEYDFWMNQIEEHSGKEGRAALLENSIRNANLLERLIGIIHSGVDKHKDKMLEKLKTEVKSHEIQ
jgi:integrase